MLFFRRHPAVCASVIPAGLREVWCAINKLKRCQTSKPKRRRRTVLMPRGRAQTTPKDIPLPPPFHNDGTESKDLSKDVSALKLQLYDQRSQSHQTPSPHCHSSTRHASPTRYATEWSGSSGRFSTKHPDARSSSPGIYRRSPSRRRDL